jgi:hypothetical protein
MSLAVQCLMVVLALAAPAFGLFMLVYRRRRFLARLLPHVERGMRRMTKDLFTAPPSVSRDEERVLFEGESHDQRVALRAAFTGGASSRYMRTGYKSGLSAEMKVSVRASRGHAAAIARSHGRGSRQSPRRRCRGHPDGRGRFSKE